MLYNPLNNKKAFRAAASESWPLYPDIPQPLLSPLQDRFGRNFDYVRIALTEKCNLRCTYCMPEEGVDFQDKDKLLQVEEIQRLIEVLATLGVNKVRFTGGEPLIRKDIGAIVAGAANTPGVMSVHLTTNGILFPRYAEELRAAGLDGVNLSLDSLDSERFERITRRTGLEKVLESIQLALDLGFSAVKVNVVMMRGFNDDELAPFCELTRHKALTVRFIEFMPFDAHQLWENGEHFASADFILKRITALYPSIGRDEGTPTEHHVYRVPGYSGKLAVIPAFTRSLCGNCSRIRITADGGIRNCLYSDDEYSLMRLLRKGGTDEEIVRLFRKAFREKHKDGFEAKKHSTIKRLEVADIGRVSMTQIGG